MSNKEHEIDKDDWRYLETLQIEQLRQNTVFLGMLKEFETEARAIQDQLLQQCTGIVMPENLQAINYINGRAYQMDFALGWLERYEAVLKRDLERSSQPTMRRAGDR